MKSFRLHINTTASLEPFDPSPPCATVSPGVSATLRCLIHLFSVILSVISHKMTIAKQTSGELKIRVNTCLNKLADRDTLSMATYELENIARALSTDAFAPFLNCISSTDSSEKSPVRRQCVRLLGVLSVAHGDALSPHLSRMISAVLRRLRDPDSAVRAACVDAVASITSNVTSQPFATVLKPLIDALFHEQDMNAQIGLSLCLSAAVDAAGKIDVAELRKLLAKVLKLVRSECFKAKPALLLFIGSIVSSGCARSKSLITSLISTVVEFLGSEDWAARKAAAEVLEKVAVVEIDLAPEFKVQCVSALESRRFDKVKVWRETMNRALEKWRDVPAPLQEVSAPPKDTLNRRSPVLPCRSLCDSGLQTPAPMRKIMPTLSPALSYSSTASSRETILGSEEDKSSKLNTRKNFLVFPLNCDDNLNLADEDVKKHSGKELEDLCVIRKQLMQIENQQSSLLDLLQIQQSSDVDRARAGQSNIEFHSLFLQRFMGSSEKGMSSLEKRVAGLEKVVGEIKHGLAMPTKGILGPECAGNTCCILAGAEFLSPKFWRKTEGQNVNS
ncbi:UNVERIFIED_CONTAM: TORTIFOLIA1-like protein 4 [Sesamum calycinum]|uniref:TORTIFOLIA1-like protein 4 n=1 Tax=Sesamum calycinum TaxID=2727403 RepID=A0AAW2QXB1_9LAMI